VQLAQARRNDTFGFDIQMRRSARDVAEILSLFRDGLTASAWSPTICASMCVLENADARPH
jgi:hypothetical protein